MSEGRMEDRKEGWQEVQVGQEVVQEDGQGRR